MKGLHSNVGACIYCEASGPELTREHVLPRGLGGNDAPDGYVNALVLQRASCQSCQKITQRIEDACLVAMMGPARARLGLRRRDRFSSTTMAHVDRHDGLSEHREAAWNEVPGAIALPAFYEAPFLSGGPVPEFPPCDYQFRIVAPARPMQGDARRVGVSLVADSRMFARMLAKIGLGLAVARIGMQGYEPLVRGLILSGTDKHGVVGGYAGAERAEPQEQSLHTLRLATNGGVLGNLIIAEIRLFAEFNGPTNYVVVGRWL
jgi:hypothetical protein